MQALLRVEEEEVQRRAQERRAQTEDEERRFQQVLPSSGPACLPASGRAPNLERQTNIAVF